MLKKFQEVWSSAFSNPRNHTARLMRGLMAGTLFLGAGCKIAEQTTAPTVEPVVDVALKTRPKTDEKKPIRLESEPVPLTAREFYENKSFCHGSSEDNTVFQPELELKPVPTCEIDELNIEGQFDHLIDIEKQILAYRIGAVKGLSKSDSFKKKNALKRAFLEASQALMGCISNPQDLDRFLSIAEMDSEPNYLEPNHADLIMSAVVPSINVGNIGFLRERLRYSSSDLKWAFVKAVEERQLDFDEETAPLIQTLFNEYILKMAKNDFYFYENQYARMWAVPRLAKIPGEEITRALFEISEADPYMGVREEAILALRNRPPLFISVKGGKQLDEVNLFLIDILSDEDHPKAYYSLRGAALKALKSRQGKEVTLALLDNADSFVSLSSVYGQGFTMKVLGCRKGPAVQKKLMDDFLHQTWHILDHFSDGGANNRDMESVTVDLWHERLDALIRQVEADPENASAIYKQLGEVSDLLVGDSWTINNLRSTLNDMLSLWSSSSSFEERLIQLIQVDGLARIKQMKKWGFSENNDQFIGELKNIQRSLDYFLQNGQGDWITQFKELRDQIKEDPDLKQILEMIDATLKEAETQSQDISISDTYPNVVYDQAA